MAQSKGSASSKRLGARIRSVREENGLTRAELASKVCVSESHLARLEAGASSPGERTFYRLAHVLGVRFAWLSRGDKPRTPDAAEKRLIRIAAELDSYRDEHLEMAIEQAPRRYHRSLVGLARAFAQKGERHKPAGWIARLDEIANVFSPLLKKHGIWVTRAKPGSANGDRKQP